MAQSRAAEPDVELSRTMSHALRHEPDAYGLVLEDDGWVTVDALVSGLRTTDRWRDLTAEDVHRVVAGASKRRHELDGAMIRAVYGHSVVDRVAYAAATPPYVLFHGTTTAAAARIAAEGLRPMRRQYVHLSADRAVAVTVGARRQDPPVVLAVDAARAAADGLWFANPDGQLWLAEAVPANYVAAGRCRDQAPPRKARPA